MTDESRTQYNEALLKAWNEYEAALKDIRKRLDNDAAVAWKYFNEVIDKAYKDYQAKTSIGQK